MVIFIRAFLLEWRENLKTYINDAIIGNKELKVSLTEKGEIIRICYPNVDFRQLIDFMHMGVKINDSNIIYLHNDPNNIYTQKYIEDSNILKTEIKNMYFNLRMEQIDFVPIGHNCIIRKYVFSNEHDIPLDIKFLIHSKMLTDENEFISAKAIDNGLLQYSHGYNMLICSNDLKQDGYKIHDADNAVYTGILQDKDYIGMTNNSAVRFEVGLLKPNEKKEFSVIISIANNIEKNMMEGIDNHIDDIRKLDIRKELQNTKKYWNKYINSHMVYSLDDGSLYKEKVNSIYKRTILLYPLLTNAQTGGISAAMEIDESFSMCGRYSYCWPRDSVYITKAQDFLKMEKETEKFYKVFCKNTQSKNGMWEQRFYTDGTLAPCWGYQIDETASVIFGIYDHYTRIKDAKFLKDNLKMIEKAIKFLDKYVDDITNGNCKCKVSYDLWEMHEGVYIYSLACIFAAYDAMSKIYKVLEKDGIDNRLKQENVIKQEDLLKQNSEKIKKYVLDKFYDDEKKSFISGENEKKLDISILGLVTPFNMFLPNDKKITNTIERINMNLRTYTRWLFKV